MVLNSRSDATEDQVKREAIQESRSIWQRGIQVFGMKSFLTTSMGAIVRGFKLHFTYYSLLITNPNLDQTFFQRFFYPKDVIYIVQIRYEEQNTRQAKPYSFFIFRSKNEPSPQYSRSNYSRILHVVSSTNQ